MEAHGSDAMSLVAYFPPKKTDENCSKKKRTRSEVAPKFSGIWTLVRFEGFLEYNYIECTPRLILWQLVGDCDDKQSG